MLIWRTYRTHRAGRLWSEPSNGSLLATDPGSHETNVMLPHGGGPATMQTEAVTWHQ
jgi:hypothetical protein